MTRNVVLICLDSVRKDYFDRYAKRLVSAQVNDGGDSLRPIFNKNH